MVNDYTFQDNDLHDQIIAMDNTLINKATKFSAVEQRLFYITLASIKPNQKENEIEIDKKAMMDMLGFTSHHYYSRIRPMFLKLMQNSMICFGDNEIWCDGFLFSKVRTTKKKVYVTVDQDYIPLLIELQPGFTRLLSDDAISFKSKFSMLLYQQLMRWNTKGIYGATTRQLKELFGLSKEDYVNAKTGRFDRYTFEQRTIDVAINDINEKSKCITNLRVEKRKKGNRVQGYVFFFDYRDPNEFREIHHQQTTIDDYIDNDDTELNKLLCDLKDGNL